MGVSFDFSGVGYNITGSPTDVILGSMRARCAQLFSCDPVSFCLRVCKCRESWIPKGSEDVDDGLSNLVSSTVSNTTTTRLSSTGTRTTRTRVSPKS